MPKVFSKCLITRSLNSPEVSLIALNIKIGGRRMKHNFRTQLPPVVYRAYVLEQQSASYLLSTHLTEQAALDRLAVDGLAAEQRKFSPNCQAVCWRYVLHVENGVIDNRRDLSLANRKQEECAA